MPSSIFGEWPRSIISVCSWINVSSCKLPLAYLLRTSKNLILYLLQFLQLVDGSIRIFALEYITAAYQYVYPGFHQSWGGLSLHPAIHLDECMAATLVDEFAQSGRLLDGVFYKLLSAESWVYAHQQYHIYIADNVFQYAYRG